MVAWPRTRLRGEPEHMHGKGRTPAPLAGRSHLVWPAGGAAGWPGGPEGDGSLRPRVLCEDPCAGFVSMHGEAGGTRSLL